MTRVSEHAAYPGCPDTPSGDGLVWTQDPGRYPAWAMGRAHETSQAGRRL